MNARQTYLMLAVLIACLLVTNAISVVLLFRQQSEMEAMRAELIAGAAKLESVGGEEAPAVPSQPTGDGPTNPRKRTPVPGTTEGETFLQQNTSASTPTQRTYTPAEQRFIDERREFLQANFTNFVPLPLKLGKNGEATIHRFRISTNVIGVFQQARYAGFRFTVPQWIDGDFEWMYMHLTGPGTKGRYIPANWMIIPEKGEMKGFTGYDLKPLTEFPELAKRYTNSTQVFIQTLPRANFKPGERYAIFFSHFEAKSPDIGIALTINSERGHRLYGLLPLK
jgi:hypothetical protein